MYKLETLNTARLSILEFGQHLKSIVNNVNTLKSTTGAITDIILYEYITDLSNGLILYDKAMLQITKSDETEKIVQADKVRDIAVIVILRYLSVFEYSDIEEERFAFASLETLFKTYKNIQNWNFEEESNGLDNLINDLEGVKYASQVALLQMSAYVQRIKIANAQFKTVFDIRTIESSTKEVYDSKTLRAKLKDTYSDMVNYTLSMAKAKKTEEFIQTLSVINTVRKYYADLLAKRKTSKTGEIPKEIPPMI